MSIEKYTTKAFVLAMYDNGENDKSFKLFTRDFGLIIAHARGIRKLESKLRGHILVGHLILVTIVQGKEVWRITGCEEINIESRFRNEVIKIIERFIKGEGSHKKLFDKLNYICETVGNYNESDLRLFTYFILLVDLGYADATIIGAKNIEEYKSWSVEDLYVHFVVNKNHVKKHIQIVMKEIQL